MGPGRRSEVRPDGTKDPLSVSFVLCFAIVMLATKGSMMHSIIVLEGPGLQPTTRET